MIQEKKDSFCSTPIRIVDAKRNEGTQLLLLSKSTMSSEKSPCTLLQEIPAITKIFSARKEKQEDNPFSLNCIRINENEWKEFRKAIFSPETTMLLINSKFTKMDIESSAKAIHSSYPVQVRQTCRFDSRKECAREHEISPSVSHFDMRNDKFKNADALYSRDGGYAYCTKLLKIHCLKKAKKVGKKERLNKFLLQIKKKSEKAAFNHIPEQTEHTENSPRMTSLLATPQKKKRTSSIVPQAPMKESLEDDEYSSFQVSTFMPLSKPFSELPS